MSTALAEIGFTLGGLRRAGCAARVERELRAAPGVREASVNFATQRALVRFDSAATDAAALARRVEALGYRAARFDPQALERPGDRDARAALARLLVAAFLAGNLMVISFALYFGARQRGSAHQASDGSESASASQRKARRSPGSMSWRAPK